MLTAVTRPARPTPPPSRSPPRPRHPKPPSAAVRSLFAVVEAYPDIKSQQNVLDLQDEIERLEAMIADRRELYNDQVYRYNTRISDPADPAARLGLWLGATRVLRGRPRGDGSPGQLTPVSDTDAGTSDLARPPRGDRVGEVRTAHRPQRHSADRRRAAARPWPWAVGWPATPFALVLTSPRSRAAETAHLAGFPDAVVDPNLGEWDYGEFEGRTTADIRAEVPDWSIWTGPWHRGETVDDVGRRADRIIERCLAPGVDGDVLLFAHGHLLRVLAARWIELPPDSGRASPSGRQRSGSWVGTASARVIETWNEACHLTAGVRPV